MSDASEAYEKIVRLKLTDRPPTRDETSRVDHFEHVLEMVLAEAKTGKPVVSASNNLALQAPVEILAAPQGKPAKSKKR